MLLHFNLTSATCQLNSGWFLDKDSEFYWTWKFFYDDDEKKEQTIWQGFSLGCELDGGYSFNDSGLLYKMMNDPEFQIKLPELKEGESKQIFLQLYCWESDQCTDIVKKSFTNTSLENLWEIAKKVDERKDKVKEEFLKWLKDGDNSIVSAIISAGSIDANAIKIARGVLDLGGFAVDLIQSNGDDLIGVNSFVLSIAKKNGQNYYRWTFHNDTGEWQNEKSEIPKTINFQSADAKNIIRTDVRLSMFSEMPGTFE
jgi:hypothetical protein